MPAGAGTEKIKAAFAVGLPFAKLFTTKNFRVLT
jgi:hypothetical protein